MPESAPRAACADPRGPVTAVLPFADDDAAQACWRAALVARDRRAPLHLVGAYAPALEGTAAAIRAHLGLDVTCEAAAPAAVARRAAAQVRLVVLPAPARAAWPLSWARISLPERLARAGRTPVLVVRRPAQASYRRVVVAVPARPEAARHVVASAHSLSRDPRMTVLHVLPPGDEEIMLAAGVPQRVRLRERDRAIARASAALAAIVRAAGAEEDGAQPRVQVGDAAAEVLRAVAAEGAELLVVGVPPRARWCGWWPATTRRLLQDAVADVLLVPLGTAACAGRAGALQDYPPVDKPDRPPLRHARMPEPLEEP